MGEIVSVSRNFPATGSEGIGRGIRLRNAELIRKMPFRDNWNTLRIGVWYSMECFGIDRTGKLPGSGFYVGVCSGPWGIGDPLGRTFRAVGVNAGGQTASNVGYDWINGYTRQAVGSDFNRYISNITRGSSYYVASSTGSYENGGTAQNRVCAGGVSLGGANATTYWENGPTPRRSAFLFDIFRRPYNTAWSFRQHNSDFNAGIVVDLPLVSYLSLLHSKSAISLDGWYGINHTVSLGTTTAMSIGVDTRNAPMDHFDLYWDNDVLALEIWRIDVLKIS